ncbi:MAG TPA: hypothetical protein VH054_10590 [Polyangiaceae bacterium]|jgi:hypothetical protein|nr:hypothetical protein [Polyangiaceae bacterium]
MRTFILGCGAAALIACGGRTDDKLGLEGPSSGTSAADYPAGDYGYDIGKVVPNVAFVGWEHTDPATTIDTKADPIGTVRISDFYDPSGLRGLTYLVVSVHVVWCAPSNEQDDFTNGANWTGGNTGGANFAERYASKGVRFMTLLEQGPTFGTDATLDDLRGWVTHHVARTSQALVSRDEMALDVVGPAWPYNMIVDLRTMRVVDTWLGFDVDNVELDAFTGLPNRVALH